jgi:hypothetical protein
MFLLTSLPTIGKNSVPHPTDEAHGPHRGRAAWSKTFREVGVVLSSQEQRISDDVLRFWAEEVEEPSRPAPSRTKGSSRDQADLPVAVVAGTWIAITLILFGAMIAALSVAVITALGWALWHNWPRLSGQSAPGSSPDKRWNAD